MGKGAKLRFAALNTGPDIHLLDHIAPIAEELQCPLFVTEELNFKLAEKFYPQVKVHLIEDLERKLGWFAQEFDALIECKYWQPHLKWLFKTLYQKEMRLIFCPHGQSDKGYGAPLLAPYALQDEVLIYGDLMLEMLKGLNIDVPKYSLVGNYRLKFYQKYRTFYDRLVPKVDKKKKTLLYAPTWCDLDESSSFFQYGKRVFEELPNDWNLIVKVHPLLRLRNPAECERYFENRPNVFLLEEFPPVYPILALADVYLGDSSSVGYDFLYFEKPLYFFPPAKRGRLHDCGTILDIAKPIYEQLKFENPYLEQQKNLYRIAFKKCLPFIR